MICQCRGMIRCRSVNTTCVISFFFDFLAVDPGETFSTNTKSSLTEAHYIHAFNCEGFAYLTDCPQGHRRLPSSQTAGVPCLIVCNARHHKVTK
jgi:hypothetical protein